MMLSRHALEAMGFTEYPETDTLDVTFSITKVYSLRGVEFEKDCKLKQSGVASFGNGCTSVIGHSVNEACKTLTGDVFIDDEAKWLADNMASPPFLLVHFRESAPHTLRGGYRKQEGRYILAYDAFPEGKKEIQDWEDATEPSIIISLTVRLSTLERHVEIIPLDRRVTGRTRHGRPLDDVEVTFRGTGYAPSPRSIEDITRSLDKAETLSHELRRESIRHFHAALNERDRLKRFLGLFLFLETFTNETLKSLCHEEKNAEQPLRVTQRVDGSASTPSARDISKCKNLTERFRLCADRAWGHLDDQDIDCFIELKGVRNRLVHGKRIDESDLPVDKARTLGLKLLGTRRTWQCR